MGILKIGAFLMWVINLRDMCPNRQFMITRIQGNGVTLPSVKTTYTERRSPDGEQVQESRKPG